MTKEVKLKDLYSSFLPVQFSLDSLSPYGPLPKLFIENILLCVKHISANFKKFIDLEVL